MKIENDAYVLLQIYFIFICFTFIYFIDNFYYFEQHTLKQKINRGGNLKEILTSLLFLVLI